MFTRISWRSDRTILSIRVLPGNRIDIDPENSSHKNMIRLKKQIRYFIIKKHFILLFAPLPVVAIEVFAPFGKHLKHLRTACAPKRCLM